MLSGRINKRNIPCIAFLVIFTTIAAITFLWYINQESGNSKTIQADASEIINQLKDFNEHMQTCINNDRSADKSLLNIIEALDEFKKNIKDKDSSALDSVHKIEKQVLLFQNIIQKNTGIIEPGLKELNLVQNHIEQKFIKISDNLMIRTYIISIIFILLFAVTFFSIMFTGSRLNKPLRQAITGLAESTTHVTKASLNVSSVSQMVADRTSEQAELLQDILSSLKEIASMSNQNAEDVNTADRLMKNIKISAEETTLFMDAFAGFMEKITSASEQSSRIVQSIDDVAFQTNILALNAAIEAARVGNAGEGFAVVADEVRSLSHQVTKASGEISDLLKGISLKISEGMKKFKKTNHICSH